MHTNFLPLIQHVLVALTGHRTSAVHLGGLKNLHVVCVGIDSGLKLMHGYEKRRNGLKHTILHNLEKSYITLSR